MFSLRARTYLELAFTYCRKEPRLEADGGAVYFEVSTGTSNDIIGQFASVECRVHFGRASDGHCSATSTRDETANGCSGS